MENKQDLPLILVTNDDGVDALGIKVLASVAKHFGKVVVVAPARAQSGKSHAITFSTPLRYRMLKDTPEMEVYKVYGTPVDAFKIADREILKDRRPDLLLSGINHGSNTSASLIYSGTMATVIEGCLNGIPAIGFSLTDNGQTPDFEACRMYVYSIIYQALKHRMPADVCLNVNIPAVPKDQIAGVRVTRQALNHWHESLEKRLDPQGHAYFWLTGHLGDEDKGEDTDEWAVKHNFISVQPVQVDMTAYHYMDTLKTWNF
ncbi:MAG: 5'/3'-nucleotidase SurE [Bacteroidales bacterium]|nr:5'/3'-nucleotidase SurE [Bacteroidales bacterium]